MFTSKRRICTNKGDNSKFNFARIMPLFGLRIFSEKAATAKQWHPPSSALVQHIEAFVSDKTSDWKTIQLVIYQTTEFWTDPNGKILVRALFPQMFIKRLLLQGQLTLSQATNVRLFKIQRVCR